jgi:hypothetical protein
LAPLLDNSNNIKQEDSNNTEAPEESTIGIVYRIPVKGKLMVYVCEEKNNANQCVKGGFNEIISTSIPQLGQTFVLPYQNGIFQNNLVKAEFSPDGNLTKFQYEEKSSQAEVASDTFNQVAAKILEGTKDITSIMKTSGFSKTQQLKDATAELQAKADYEKVKLALQSSENERKASILNSETALLDAERKRVEAEQALSKVRNQTP